MLARVASKEEAAARVAAEREEERKALARQKDEELDSLRRVAEQQKAEALEAARQAHSEAANAQRLEAEALLARRLREEKERAEAERSALEEKAKADRLALERSFEEKAEAARQDAAAKAAQASELARRASVSGFFRAAGAEEARRRLLADAEEKARLTALEAENKIARVEAATEDKVRRAMEEAARVLEEEEARRRAVEEAERARRREAEIKAALEGVLEQIWSKNWAEVQLWGNGAGSWSTGSIYKFKTPAELDECKEAIGKMASSYLPIFIDLYNSGCTARQYMALSKDAAGPETFAASDSAWDVHMAKNSWVNFCTQLGSPALDRYAALQVFAQVNERRDRAIEEAKIKLLHKGKGITLCENLMSQASMALGTNSFHLSEFIEGCIACAPLVAGRPDKTLRFVDQAKLAVVEMLDRFVVPYAKRCGLVGFRDALTSLPTIESTRTELTPLLAHIWKTYSGQQQGLSLAVVLGFTELFDPDIPRARIKAVFLETLGANLHLPSGAKRFLGQESLWELLVRIALLRIAVSGSAMDIRSPPPAASAGAPPSQQAQTGLTADQALSGAELGFPLFEMSDAQLRDLRDALQQMEQIVGSQADQKVVNAAAARALQAAVRGKKTRKRMKMA